MTLRHLLFLAAASAVVSCSFVEAGEYNPDRSIGDAAPAWSKLAGVDDQKHSLADLKDKKAVVVVFTCNSCPYAVDALERVKRLAGFCKKNDAGLVAINVNKVPSDSFAAMKELATAEKLDFPYLFDESQQIAKAYGARYTPEFFVLDKERKIAYMGSLDDSPDGRAVKQKYVETALVAVLAGKTPTVTETVPIGCRIRFDRVRRTRKPAKTADSQ